MTSGLLRSLVLLWAAVSVACVWDNSRDLIRQFYQRSEPHEIEIHILGAKKDRVIIVQIPEVECPGPLALSHETRIEVIESYHILGFVLFLINLKYATCTDIDCNSYFIIHDLVLCSSFDKKHADIQTNIRNRAQGNAPIGTLAYTDDTGVFVKSELWSELSDLGHYNRLELLMLSWKQKIEQEVSVTEMNRFDINGIKLDNSSVSLACLFMRERGMRLPLYLIFDFETPSRQETAVIVMSEPGKGVSRQTRVGNGW